MCYLNMITKVNKDTCLMTAVQDRIVFKLNKTPDSFSSSRHMQLSTKLVLVQRFISGWPLQEVTLLHCGTPCRLLRLFQREYIAICRSSVKSDTLCWVAVYCKGGTFFVQSTWLQLQISTTDHKKYPNRNCMYNFSWADVLLTWHW